MNNVAGNAVLPQFRCDVANFGLSLVGDAAHPQTERPQRRDGASPCKCGVVGKNVLGFTEKDEKVQGLIATVEHVRLVERLSEITNYWRAGMYKHAVPAIAQEERDRLI